MWGSGKESVRVLAASLARRGSPQGGITEDLTSCQHQHTAHVHYAQTSMGCDTISAICVESKESDEPGGRTTATGTAILIAFDESGDPTVARGSATTTGTVASADTCSSGGDGGGRDVAGLESERFLELSRALPSPASPPRPSPSRGRGRRGALSESAKRSRRTDAQNRPRRCGRRRRNPVGCANPADGAVGDREDSTGEVVEGAHGSGHGHRPRRRCG